jgi:thioredoxin-like negative regulator of GroEL
MANEAPFDDTGGFDAALRRAAQLTDADDHEAAEREYARAVALQPWHVAAQYGLANLRYMRGDPYFARDFAAACARYSDHGVLQLQFANVLRHAGDLDNSELLLRDLIARGGAFPELRSSLATVLHEAGRLSEAEVEARGAANARPNDAQIALNLAAVLLSLGRADEALTLARAQRRRAPFDYTWIAHEATAARLVDDPAYASLYDYERLVRVYDLDAAPGGQTIAELNAALAARLAQGHRLPRPPLGQSVRFGTQTRGDLLADPDPAVRAALEMFLEPIADYRAKLGQDPDHPLAARNRGDVRYAGCWSVQLKQHGFHVNHLHPNGWLSSAYYVAVPSETHDPASQSGHLKLGEPAVPVPGAGPALTIEPRAGRLVLFPSYMWHGTTAIHGTEPRLTIAFDAVTA